MQISYRFKWRENFPTQFRLSSVVKIFIRQATDFQKWQSDRLGYTSALPLKRDLKRAIFSRTEAVRVIGMITKTLMELPPISKGLVQHFPKIFLKWKRNDICVKSHLYRATIFFSQLRKTGKE